MSFIQLVFLVLLSLTKSSPLLSSSDSDSTDSSSNFDCSISDIYELEDVLEGYIVSSSSSTWFYDRIRWYNINFFSDIPNYIIYAFSEHDAQLAYNFVICNDQKFVVRSGGHSIAGYSNINDGIIIDMSNLNRIKPYSENGAEYLKLGPGVLSSQLMEYYSTAGYYTPITFCSAVAVGGYFQGGGNSVTSRTTGLFVDFVEEVRVITPDGTLRVANSNQNEDLFYALRGGGGGNWGIVTEITIKPKQQTTIVATTLFFEIDYVRHPDIFKDVMRAGVDYILEYDNEQDIPYNFNIYAVGYADSVGYILIWITDSTSQQDVQEGENFLNDVNQYINESLLSKPVYQNDYPDIAENEFCAVSNLEAFFECIGGQIVADFAGTVAARLLPRVEDLNNQFLQGLNDYLRHRQLVQQAEIDLIDPNLTVLPFLWELLGGQTIANDPDFTLTSYPSRDALISVIIFVNYIDEPNQPFSEEVVASYNQSYLELNDIYDLTGTTNRYLNYHERRVQSLEANYYADYDQNSVIFSQLKQIKAKYDPNNYFNFPLSVPLADVDDNSDDSDDDSSDD